MESGAPGDAQRGRGLGGVVVAAQRFEQAVGEALHTKREAVYTGGAKTAKAGRVGGNRIGFQRNLAVRCQRQDGVHGVDYLGNVLGFQQRRGAAAKVDCARRAVSAGRRPAGDHFT